MVIAELGKIGFSNIADYVEMGGKKPTLCLADAPPDKLAAISCCQSR